VTERVRGARPDRAPDTAVTLRRVEAFAPGRVTTVEDVGPALGLNRRQVAMFRRVRGLDQFRYDPALDTFDLALRPAQAVLRSVSGTCQIRYLVFAHTVRDFAPCHISAADVVCERLGLTGTEAFAVTQNDCASGLAAVDIAGNLLRAEGDPDAAALVLTGEKHPSRLVRLVQNASLMGEAGAACLVCLGGPGGRILSCAVRTAGEFAGGFLMSTCIAAQFNQSYESYVIEVMEEALDRAGRKLSDVTMIVPHNVNVSSWRKLCTRLGLDLDLVFLDNVGRYGHCYCADPFLNLVSMRDRGLLTNDGLYLLVSVGIGGTYAAMVIEHQAEH
jgi:3-oxoacyl-[acyl-carrier-protein] synthase-3